SDMLNKAVERPKVTETTAFGAACLAGLAVGYWKKENVASDDIGESQYNVELSERRARTVGAFLRNLGISVDQVNIRGVGSISGGQRELNRRVDLVVELRRER
ncbi:MAG: OmpA family protein, partial [Bacteroidota bacterium]